LLRTWPVGLLSIGYGRPERADGLSDGAGFTPRHTWYTDYFLAVEHYRRLDARHDNLHAGHLGATLQPGAECDQMDKERGR
jgi:hypothetical protein